MKYIRILNLLKKISFGMSIFLFAVSLLSALAHNFEVNGTVGGLIIIAFIFLIPGLVIRKVIKGIRIRRLAEQREKFYSILEDPDQGIFPANVILKGNETCFLNDYVVMKEIVRESIRTYTGTRLKLGRIPVYFGGGKSVPNETYSHFTFGELLLTNFRLIFIGKHISMNQPKHIAYAFQASLKNIALKDIQTMHRDTGEREVQKHLGLSRGNWCY